MNLSQAEIEAMMSGTTAPAPTGEISQAEIDAMMAADANADAAPLPPDVEPLTSDEIDTLGEVGNICMGAVATTMYTLLDRRVEITTPRVSIGTMEQVFAEYSMPFVLVDVEYVEGLEGKNILVIKEYDAALITDVLMGGEGTVVEPIELSELHMSALNEIMNQMTAASANALSQLIHEPVNISTPNSVRMDAESELKAGNHYPAAVIIVTFSMEIEDLLSSNIIQMMPYDQGRDLVEMLIHMHDAPPAPQAPAPTPQPTPAPPPPAPAPAPAPPPAPPPIQAAPDIPSQPMPAPRPHTGFERPPLPVPGGLVDVRPLEFEPFDREKPKEENTRGGIGIISDIPLVVAAELGTASKNLSEVLAFKPGAVIMLNKAAGDPVEVKVNGKQVARGEVVIIDDNYGIRITDLPNK